MAGFSASLGWSGAEGTNETCQSPATDEVKMGKEKKKQCVVM